jgi:hypothetical protein
MTIFVGFYFSIFFLEVAKGTQNRWIHQVVSFLLVYVNHMGMTPPRLGIKQRYSGVWLDQDSFFRFKNGLLGITFLGADCSFEPSYTTEEPLRNALDVRYVLLVKSLILPRVCLKIE